VEQGQWLQQLLPLLQVSQPLTMADVRKSYEEAGLDDFELFWDNKPMNDLWRVGLWVL
jgi:hypothetical protein